MWRRGAPVMWLHAVADGYPVWVCTNVSRGSGYKSERSSAQRDFRRSAFVGRYSFSAAGRGARFRAHFLVARPFSPNLIETKSSCAAFAVSCASTAPPSRGIAQGLSRLEPGLRAAAQGHVRLCDLGAGLDRNDRDAISRRRKSRR